MAFNAANLTKCSPANVTGPSLFVYYTKTDTVTTTSQPGYFTPFADSLSQALLTSQMNVGDTIQCTCSDGSVDLDITSIDPIATTVQTETVIVGPNSVNTASIQNLAVTTAKIDNLAVTAAKIANTTITNTQIAAAAAIDYSKLAALTSGNVLVGSAGNVATSVAMTGDVTISNTGVTAIAGGSIVNTDVNAAAAIDYSKLAALTSGNVLVGSAGNVATSVAMTGDITISNTGVTAIGAAKVTTAMLDPQTIQYVKVPVTAAQWNGMYAAPFVLIAAPGAGKMIVVQNAILAMTFVAAQYADGGVVALQYDSTVFGAGSLASATLAAATVNGYAATSSVGLAGAAASGASSAKVDKGIYISNQTGAFTTGDGTWFVHVWYQIVTL